jgi:hypothetical protein
MENLGITLQDYANFGQGFGSASQQEVQDLMKAMMAEEITGRDTTNLTTASGAPLKVESLEATLKILTNTERDIVFWKMLPKLPAYNTVEEYNQLASYGVDGAAFTNEGELPESVDSQYVRRAQLVKFMGSTREVTHPMQLVSTMVGDMIKRETINGTQWVLRQLEKALPFADSAKVPQEFNGLFSQHFTAFNDTLDNYQNSTTVVDLRGNALSDAAVESAVESINVNYGFADKIIAPPIVFSNYVKQFHGSKLIQPNTQQVTAGIMGQKVVGITTQFGDIAVVDDKFWKSNPSRIIGSAATNVKAPNAPLAGGTSALASDTNNRFVNFIGDYYYAVAAKNRYGESTLQQIGSSAGLVLTAGNSVNLTFQDGGGAYPATAYVIYRSTVNPNTAIGVTQLYPIFTVAVSDLSAGYDGAAAGSVWDRNRYISNTEQALVCEMNDQILSFKQLAPLMKMDLAVLSPSTRFMVLLYGTPILYAGLKVTRIINIGSILVSPTP